MSQADLEKLNNDPELKQTYIATVAAENHDVIEDPDLRNTYADDILDTIFRK